MGRWSRRPWKRLPGFAHPPERVLDAVSRAYPTVRLAGTLYSHTLADCVFKEGPYRFFFFSREEARIHVHVICASDEAKFWLDPAVELAVSKGISAHESREMQRIIERRKEEIVDAWNQHFAC